MNLFIGCLKRVLMLVCVCVTFNANAGWLSNAWDGDSAAKRQANSLKIILKNDIIAGAQGADPNHRYAGINHINDGPFYVRGFVRPVISDFVADSCPSASDAAEAVVFKNYTGSSLCYGEQRVVYQVDDFDEKMRENQQKLADQATEGLKAYGDALAKAEAELAYLQSEEYLAEQNEDRTDILEDIFDDADVTCMVGSDYTQLCLVALDDVQVTPEGLVGDGIAAMGTGVRSFDLSTVSLVCPAEATAICDQAQETLITQDGSLSAIGVKNDTNAYLSIAGAEKQPVVFEIFVPADEVGILAEIEKAQFAADEAQRAADEAQRAADEAQSNVGKIASNASPSGATLAGKA